MSKKTKHLLVRLLFFFSGFFLFYHPFAFLVRAAAAVFPKASYLSYLKPTVHQPCLRMPFNWIIMPWMYSNFLQNPLYFFPFFLLALSFVFGPLFCGWVCPAGNLTEHISRVIPKSFQLELRNLSYPQYLRYGFLLGFLLSPFLVRGSFCCFYCNFSFLQNLVDAAFGDFTGISYWFFGSIITFLLWFFLLGIFAKGGRGWCNFLCPAGAFQGVFHWFGGKFPFTYGVKISNEKCNHCSFCADVCSTGALNFKGERISFNRHMCNACLDCKNVCPVGAIDYKKGNS